MTDNPFERLVPTGSSYARLPLLQAFNWADVLADTPPRQWYVVAFRSIRRATADPAYLKLLDDLAYEEALRVPGLLLYFRGTMTDRRECLSICIWESQEQAQAATRLAAHQAAADITDDMYEVFELERWILLKRQASLPLELHAVPLDPTHLVHRRRSAFRGDSSSLIDLDGLPPAVFMPPARDPGHAI